MSRTLIGLAAAVVCISLSNDAFAARGLHVSDVVRLENFEYDSFRLSPDGLVLAFGMIRPVATARRLPANLPSPSALLEIDGHSRSDIWLQDGPGRPVRNLTNGVNDGSGWWDPRWSPDGRRLAMLSSRGGQVAVWIWERATGALYELEATRNVDLRAAYSVGTAALSFFAWTDDHRLLCSVESLPRPRAPTPNFTLPLGTELSVSVLDSGIPVKLELLPQSQVRLIDVLTRDSSVLATEFQQPSNVRTHVLSNDRKTLALARLTGLAQPSAGAPTTYFEDVRPQYSHELLSLNGERPRLSADQNKRLAAPDTDAARKEYERSAKKPSERASLVVFSAEHHTAIYQEDSQDGLLAWRVNTLNGQAEELLHTNRHLADLTASEVRQLEYASLGGVPLKAALLLPVGYREGRRYPLVTWVYGGEIADKLDRYKRKYSLSASRIAGDLSLQILAARGYAVLSPSIPLKKPRTEGGTDGPDDPLLRFTDGVLPAVEQAVSAGIADGQRVVVMGHSYGGYTTYALITQTNRFRAAASLDGFSNMISNYGTFDARKRYMEFSHQRQAIIGLTEFSQGLMNNPPWKDPDRFLRNSPLTYVDRVQTPVLIIHGDQDFVPIQQAEEFFTALFRQGKRAQFARYWGEEHRVSTSAANLLDMWSRILAWFDEFGDISRDAHGEMLFEGDKPKSRNGAPALTPADFARFEQQQ